MVKKDFKDILKMVWKMEQEFIIIKINNTNMVIMLKVKKMVKLINLVKMALQW